MGVWTAGVLVALVSPSSAMVWIDVFVCAGALLCSSARSGDTKVSSANRIGASAPVPEQRRPVASDRGDGVAVASSMVQPPDIADLSDAELCRAWRVSYVRLRRLEQHPSRTRAGLAAVAHERGIYLDELQRRYPAGFAAWISAGARAPSDPLPYLRRGLDQGEGEVA